MTSTSRRVNYDLIAHLYDEPGRDFDPDPDLIRYLRRRQLPASARILDLGCGTGKQLAADHARFPSLRLFGLDLFHGMLLQARARCDRVSWVQADALCTPFPSGSFHYITNQFSYPHVPDKPRLFSEAHRLLVPGGRFAIMNIDPWSMSGWILYRYFPAARECDAADFLSEDGLRSGLRHAGFRNIRVRRSHKHTAERLGDFLAYASQRHRTSHFMEIQDSDYERGLELLRDHVADMGSDAHIPSEFCLIWVTADKPASPP